MTTTPKPIAFPELLKQATQAREDKSGKEECAEMYELIRRALEFFRAGGYAYLKQLDAFNDEVGGDPEFQKLLRILDGETGENRK